MSARHWGSDRHAAGGHEIPTTGAGIQHAPDCPKCIHGTLQDYTTREQLAFTHDRNQIMSCIDCGHLFKKHHLQKIGVIPK